MVDFVCMRCLLGKIATLSTRTDSRSDQRKSILP
ncbi:hypothetical protein N665_0061s0021 [Sinapis alba]|nr:hypothetical protein N665_0061s0021 [Sinapis alba]